MIFYLVLCGRETWSLTQGEEHSVDWDVRERGAEEDNWAEKGGSIPSRRAKKTA